MKGSLQFKSAKTMKFSWLNLLFVYMHKLKSESCLQDVKFMYSVHIIIETVEVAKQDHYIL